MAWKATHNTKTDKKTGRRVSMWTPRKEKRVYEFYVVKRLSMTDTAKLIGCAHSTVQQLLERKGWNRRIKNEKQKTLEFLSAHREKALRFYRNHSAQQLAEKQGLSLRGTILWLKTEGVFRDTPKARYDNATKSGEHVTVKSRAQSIKALLELDVNELHPLEYKSFVKRMTHYVYQDWKHIIDPRGKRSRDWHVDHIFGVAYAQYNSPVKGNVLTVRAPLGVVCHPANLRIISGGENSRRHNTRDPLSFDKAALKQRIKAFNSTHGDPFEKYK